ncbi:hypothetical protein BGW38_002163 [Lunasporangiospora selenospora]|uniref:Peptidase M48 domain-containing protein n=1 Tax=Lunasporangiospora selenospora TaxID=979761 RepID=A0A9P6FSF8_9FUNG|nr:hypothetical protein BGW38_002163 [Lunasporangiospora selenospora]
MWKRVSSLSRTALRGYLLHPSNPSLATRPAICFRHKGQNLLLESTKTRRYYHQLQHQDGIHILTLKSTSNPSNFADRSHGILRSRSQALGSSHPLWNTPKAKGPFSTATAWARNQTWTDRGLLQRTTGHRSVNTILRQGQRLQFHTSQPHRHPLPLLPVAVFTLKTPVTALVLRMISRVSLTLLPLSAKQSPKVILTLVLIPPICFGLVIFAGLEAAPNTGRWRFLFTSEAEELSMLDAELPTFMESIAVIEDDDDPRVRLVRHILNNLLSSSIEQDGSTLRTGIVERLEQRHAEAQRRLTERQQQGSALTRNEASGETGVPTKSIVSTNKPFNSGGQPTNGEDEEDPELRDMVFDDRPFQIFVAKDDAINAFSLGPPRLIYINSGLMDWLDNNEDLIAAVVAHELAHVIQRHTMETHGRETVMLFLAGPWFNSWVDRTTNELLHFTASGPLHQTIEVEADTVSLTLLALAGYDPMHAVRLWEQWADKDMKEMVETDTIDVHKWTDWMYDHPPSAERARYLKEAVIPARLMWETMETRRNKPLKRYDTIESHLTHRRGLVEEDVEEVMETMEEALRKQEEERRKRSGIMGTLKSWFYWRPWSVSTE